MVISIMFEAYNYEVNVHWQSGRVGQMSAPGIDETILCATPPEFPQGVHGIWSPEHLFTASVNSCFMTTFLAVAENFKLKYEHFSCRAIGRLSRATGKWMMSEIILKPELTICTEESFEKARKVLEKSEKACLITQSIKSMVITEPTIMVSEMCM
ncbi:OsmC family protein [Cecembia rubra]|uniref:Organic hydroperoxide reductase OsmC/OhrA n=1 Tax=Cecembia rubra TaxID=1485585 RepID=A0A2P8EE70_9BACT|nr:OsmC family protein [Cecembia rubra]PSL07770.1 organic hydroperoxide reductase OsmC/OhrA [Cecembia rubra]